MRAVLAEWGLAGIEALRGRVSVFVIVDVLSFSTAVDIAVARGASVHPFADGDRVAAEAAAARAGAVLAQRRGGGGYSLSPVSLLGIAAGTRLMLPSPNGSRLSLACRAVPVLAGCLRNASAVAQRAREMAGEGDVGVIQAGEQWPDGSLRPAIEDMLGAGAIIHHTALPCSAEAQVARDAYRAAGEEIARLVRQSVSGRELAERGFAGDVDSAVGEEASRCAPVLADGAYRTA